MGLLTEHLCRNIYDETQIKLRPLSSVIIANALSPSWVLDLRHRPRDTIKYKQRRIQRGSNQFLMMFYVNWYRKALSHEFIITNRSWSLGKHQTFRLSLSLRLPRSFSGILFSLLLIFLLVAENNRRSTFKASQEKKSQDYSPPMPSIHKRFLSVEIITSTKFINLQPTNDESEKCFCRRCEMFTNRSLLSIKLGERFL